MSALDQASSSAPDKLPRSSRPLFRIEAIQYQEGRLLGEAIQFRPLPDWLAHSAMIAVALFLFGVFTLTYEPRLPASLEPESSGPAKLTLDPRSPEVLGLTPGTVLWLESRDPNIKLRFKIVAAGPGCTAQERTCNFLGRIEGPGSTSLISSTEVIAALPRRTLLGSGVWRLPSSRR